MNKKTMNFYSYKLLGLLSVTLLSQPAFADLFKCNACPAGYKCDGSTKTICPAGTYSQAGASSCTKCKEGQISNEGASSCSYPCLKNDYTILEYSASKSSRDTYSCNVSFSNRTFSAGTKITNQTYEGAFTPSRGGCRVNETRTPKPENPGLYDSTYSVDYTGTKYEAIKFHYNSDKNKIEVIELKSSCIKKNGWSCEEYVWSNNSVIAELEASMCE